jgi:diguanylate cyclase (GGDEF)-like protein/PAS domain S-box-containing protein
MGFYIVRQLALRQRMAAELAGRDAEFRALAEGSSDVVTRIALDGTVLYASPSARRLIGWSAEQLTGRSVFAGMHADDVPKVKAQLAALIGGEVEEARISYRTRHSDKREIWLDAAVHLTRHLVTGEVDSIVAIARDVTEQKRLEDQLAALATSDSLTGIANRRRFDERLREEWARARRDGTPLSLLLIDVDHFKEYNDRYGHPAGDRCLSWIAAVLAELARRPSDLAARYGGEEFAMILANTDAAGCEHVSRQIREALRGLELAHAGNPPSERVTVSLGGATLRPVATRGRSEPGQLIESADRALYAAKHGGRDRLVMSAEVIRLSESSIA